MRQRIRLRRSLLCLQRCRVLPQKPQLKHLIIDDQCLAVPPPGAPARPQVRLPELPPLWLQASLNRELLLSGSAAIDVSSLAIGPQETAMLIAYSSPRSSCPVLALEPPPPPPFLPLPPNPAAPRPLSPSLPLARTQTVCVHW